MIVKYSFFSGSLTDVLIVNDYSLFSFTLLYVLFLPQGIPLTTILNLGDERLQTRCVAKFKFLDFFIHCLIGDGTH